MSAKILKKDPNVIETLVEDKESLLEMKFLTAQIPYDKEDMEKCVQQICEKENLKYYELFDISDTRQELILGFKEAERRLKEGDKSNFYCIHGQFDNLWLIYCVVRMSNDTFAVFYKNPRGGFVPEEIEKKLKEIFKQPVTIVLNCKDDIGRDDNNYYGPLTIRNLVKMVDIEWTEKNIIDKFKTFSFATSEDVCKEKFIIAKGMAEELGKNGDFVKDLRSFVGKIPGKCEKDLNSYAELVEDLAKGKTEDEAASLKRIENLRNKIFQDKEIKQLQADHENMCVKDEKDVIRGFKHNMENKHKLEMLQLNVMFKIVDGCKHHYDSLKAYLQPIKTSLKMTEKELESLYKIEKTLTEQQKKDKETDNSDNQKVSLYKGVKKGDAVTPLEDILKKVAIGMDPTPTSQSIASQEDQDKLKSIVTKVNDRTKAWENVSAQEVTNWAKGKKGCLKEDENEVVEALAVMNRALALASEKNMRNTQLVAVAIVLLLKKNDKAGTLCQVKTGEGKTIIVSILAAIRCLQGYAVDVITSNIVLAKEGVKDSENFFKLLNVDAKVTNDENSYTCDVLYGTISNFQFDYLRDLTEGTTIRKNRKFEQVILDEVDSMLVDNGGNIAKLSSSFPGMDCLRYIYIKIWKELHKARELYAQETKSIIAKFENEHENGDPAEFHKNYKKKLDLILDEEIPNIKKKLSQIDPCDYPLIPDHLKEYCNSKKQVWIDNAIHALYGCHENEQYRICRRDEKDEKSECFVAPVDFSNTGVTLANTVWSNGLHQFVQLKHNVELTFESLTSSFISNMGYIKLYPNDLIFGLTGTLGSTNEQKLLKEIYGVDFAKVPTYKPKIFDETKGSVVEDSSWDISVVNKVKEIVTTGRPILVICQTLKDLYLVKEKLEKTKNIVGYSKLRIFDEESKSDVTKEELAVKEVVLSTNLAGRGTNMKTLPEVEKKKGLHVCVTFLPCNVRVEDQAFGRTSRQGNFGTANLIVRQSEIENLDIPINSSFKDIKKKRNELEQERIKIIQTKLIPDLTFKDGIFGHFSRFCAELKELNKTDHTFKIFIKDLKEWWAFWLERQEYKGETLKNLDPKKEFEKFKETSQVKCITKKQISHNPQYCLQLADRFKEDKKPEEAKKCLERALELEPKGIAGAYLKLFEIKIETTSQFLERCKDAVKELFGIDTKHSDYRDIITTYLTKANELIKKEIKYNEDHLNPKSTDFKRILQIHETNSFLKHFHSRTTSIQVHQKNIESILKDCSNFDGFDFQSKVETNMQAFGKAVGQENEANKYFTNTEVNELHTIGLDTIYSLKQIKGVDKDFIQTAVAFIAAGIASLVIGLLWLPSFPLMSNIAGTLISEGIVDIVMKLIVVNSDKKDFSKGEYVKGKFMKIGKALLSFGLSAITQCTNILQKAVEFCRKVQTMLNNCTHFSEVCNCVKEKIARITDFLQIKLDKIEFGKLSEVAKKMKLDELQKMDKNLCQQLKQAEGVANQSRKALLTDFVKEVGKATAERLGVSVTKEFAIKPFIRNSMKSGVNQAVKKLFVDYFNSCSNLKKKLKKARNYKDCSNKYVDSQISFQNSNRELGKKAVEFYASHVDVSEDTLENVTEFARVVQNYANFMKSLDVIATYQTGAKNYLLNCLRDDSSDNNVDRVIDDISTIIGKPVIDIIMKAWNDANAL